MDADNSHNPTIEESLQLFQTGDYRTYINNVCANLHIDTNTSSIASLFDTIVTNPRDWWNALPDSYNSKPSIRKVNSALNKLLSFQSVKLALGQDFNNIKKLVEQSWRTHGHDVIAARAGNVRYTPKNIPDDASESGESINSYDTYNSNIDINNPQGGDNTLDNNITHLDDDAITKVAKQERDITQKPKTTDEHRLNNVKKTADAIAAALKKEKEHVALLTKTIQNLHHAVDIYKNIIDKLLNKDDPLLITMYESVNTSTNLLISST